MNINSLWMLYGFLLGILILCVMKKKTKVLIQYPTPYNAGKIQYKDSLNRCFKYNSVRTICSKNNKVITLN